MQMARREFVRSGSMSRSYLHPGGSATEMCIATFMGFLKGKSSLEYPPTKPGDFYLMAFFLGSLLDDRLKILEHGGQGLLILAGIEAVDGMECIRKLAGQRI